MLNFGLTDLWLVAPRCRLDDRAYALASHAASVLDEATVVDSLAEAIADRTTVLGTSARMRAADNFIMLSPRQAAPMMGSRTAVLFGPEDHGLGNEELTRCQAQIVIPTSDYSSLNLAQAVLLVAYEWSQSQDLPGKGLGVAEPSASLSELPLGHEPAPREKVEGFYGQLAETLLHIGYTEPLKLHSVMRIFRGITDRASPTAHEVAALRGILRQTCWAADQEPGNVPGNKVKRE